MEKNNETLSVLRHSTSHIMAQAVQKLFPSAKLAIGPAIENGFYYDFDLTDGHAFTQEDLTKIEEEMKNIVKQNLSFEKYVIPDVEKQIAEFKAEGEIYKAELLEEHKNDNPTLYLTKDKDGNVLFNDLCAGPHLPNTSYIKTNAFKLLKVAGAYWRGNENNKMLQRIYATAFWTKEDLADYLHFLEEAEKRIPRDLAMAQNSIDRLKDEGCDTSALQDALDRVKEEADNSSEKKAVLQHLKEVLRKIEDLDGQTEWNRLERQLREEFDRLEKANNDLGNEKTTQLVNQLRTETDNAIRAKDVKIGREVLENIKSLFFQLTMIYQLIGLIESCSRQFGQIRWKDAARARQLVNMGMSEISNQPAVEKLQPIAVGLLDLMPDNEARRMGSGIKNG